MRNDAEIIGATNELIIVLMKAGDDVSTDEERLLTALLNEHVKHNKREEMTDEKNY